MSLEEVTVGPPPLCEWIEPALREIAGQDPLGLQTITTDRILPGLLPGVLALSVRARYFSVYSFLLRHYARSGAVADNAGLDEFMRQREFEICVAANLCPRCDAPSVIGNGVGRPLAASRPGAYERQRSIKTQLGGYGLYYRGPMEELGLVVRRGQAMVGDTPNPIDLLQKTPRAQQLADLYERSIAGTQWYLKWMNGVDPVPAEVLEELGHVGCLCRLDEHPDERSAIADVFLLSPSPERVEPTKHRQRAFALLLDLATDEPTVLESDSSFRHAVVSTFTTSPLDTDAAGEARARWAAVVMRESAQDPLASIWTSFCRAGMAAQPFEGLTSAELDDLVRTRLVAAGVVDFGSTTITCTPDTPCAVWFEDLRQATADLSWEDIREAAEDTGDALTGLAAFLVLCARVPDGDAASAAWAEVARVDGDRQPGLARMATLVQRRLHLQASVAETLRWAIDNFIVSVHETVAMRKLPDSTFRFFWEHGRLCFVDNGVWGFDMSGLRRAALASLASDLGWWTRDDADRPGVTDSGRAVISKVFAR
ncbi:MAG TPA: hypothetical protein VI318_24825 [Baekduia sp.]